VEITLNACQQSASDKFFEFVFDANPSRREFVLQGSAGTGKTTLLRHILQMIWVKQMMVKSLSDDVFHVEDIRFTATTRKAAQVLQDVVGEETTTIHSLLGLRVVNDYRTGEQRLEQTPKSEKYTNELIIIDEASFVNEELRGKILSKTRGAKILYVGDPYQLLPTSDSTSAVFNDGVETAQLTTVMRNGGLIEELAHTYKAAVISNQFPHCIVNNTDVCHFDGASFKAAIDEAYTDPQFDANKVRILAWTNQRVHAYNKYVREELFGQSENYVKGEYVQTNKPIIADKKNIPTDSIVRISHVSHSDCGYDIEGRYVTINDITAFLPHDQQKVSEKLAVFKAKKEWTKYFDIKDNFLDLRPPYACTVHKSQGSTYDTVFIDLADIGKCYERSDVARMLYVAISRASKRVVLYGNLPPHYGSIQYEPKLLSA